MNTARPRPARRTRSRYARRSARSRGAVIVLSLLGAFMMAGMLAYVFNAGRHAQVRQETQSAADATAVSGAGYVARSFNTVAMNNVEMARLIAAVQVLDAIPLAVEYTLVDVEAYLDSVLAQQANGGTGSLEGNAELDAYEQRLRDQQRILSEMDELFNRGGVDVTTVTNYNAAGDRGEMWKAMESLDAVSYATMLQIDELMQVTAIEAGRSSMDGRTGEEISAVAPFSPLLLWERSDIDDFRRPVVDGMLPRAVDDELTNRGPFDTIFGWRDIIRRRNPNTGTGGGAAGNPPTTTTDSASSPWSNPTSPFQNTNSSGGWIPVAYRTYGTRDWLLDMLIARTAGEDDVLDDTQFAERVWHMSGHKQNYLWPGAVRPLKTMLDPEWVTDYDQAVQIRDAGTPQIQYTHFMRIEFQTRYLNDSAVGPEERIRADVVEGRGARLDPGGDKVRDHVWEDDLTLEWQTTRFETDPFGNVVEIVDEHRIDYRFEYIWLGANVGIPITITNPNPTGRSDDLPAPIDFEHDEMVRPVDGQVGRPGSPFTFLGVGKQPNTAQMWTSLYSTSAFDGQVALAQASVFNNHSWDLWTQMWHAQLEPIQDYDTWIDLMQDEIDGASGFDNLSTGELQEVIDYLDSIRELAPVMLNH